MSIEFASSKDSSQQESSDILTDVSKESTPPKKAMSLPTPYRVRGSMHGKDTRMSKSDSYRTPKRVKTSPTVDRSISKPFWLQYPKRSRYKRRKPVQPEGGFGWVVCFTSFCTNGIVLGSLNTFSIFHVEILKVYGKDDSMVSFKTALLGSVCTGLTFLMSIFASIFIDHIGLRKVAVVGSCMSFAGMAASVYVTRLEVYFVTYGVIMGTGFACTITSSLIILGHYFKKRLGLANGLVTFGGAVFTFSYSLVLPELFSYVGLKPTLLCLTGLFFLLVPCAATWTPIFLREDLAVPLVPSEDCLEEEERSRCAKMAGKCINLNIWRYRDYVLWVVGNCVSLFGYFVPFIHMVKHANDVFPDFNASLLPLCSSITSGLTRVSIGVVSDVKHIKRIYIQQVGLFVLGVVTMCIPFATSTGTLVGISLIMGVCDGMFTSMQGAIPFDLVGEQEASQALGFLYGIISVPVTFGPPAAGIMYDYFGSYRAAFHLAGVPPIIGAIIMFLIPTKRRISTSVPELEFAAPSTTSAFEM